MKTEIYKLPICHSEKDYEFISTVIFICVSSCNTEELKNRISYFFSNLINYKGLINWKYGWLSEGLLVTHTESRVLFVECDTTEIFDEI